MPNASYEPLETGKDTDALGASSWRGTTIADAEDEVIGKTLNDTYVVERVLGQGGMGRVYQARHTRITQKQVAVKVLHQEYVRNSEVLARFRREAEAAASISHPNVVAVYDVDRTPQGLPYLVCEYLQGIDLADHLRSVHKIGLATAVHIARQLCKGLDAAHQRGVIHRDLKPHNVFLVGDFAAGVPPFPFIKILDFGLSKFMDSPDGHLTKTGVIMGTPAFMAPEQALGRQADHRADIYGVGSLLYVALTGRMPFDESTPQATVLAVIGSEPPRPRALDPSIPEYAELVIQRAMSKEPADRYPDMTTLLHALEPLIENRRARSRDMGGSPLTGSLSSPDSEALRVRAARPQLVLLLLLSLGLFVGSTAIAVAGIEQTSGWRFNRLELTLVLACIAAVATTPTILWLRWIRRKVWDNTTRVMSLLAELRVAVATGVGAYGLAWLGFRAFDRVILRMMSEPARAKVVDITWPGWDFLLPLLAMGAALVALLRERLLAGALRGWKRALTLAVASLASLAMAAVVIPVGLRWRNQARVAPARSAVVAATSPAPPLAPTAPVAATVAATPSLLQPSSASAAESAPRPFADAPVELATDDELRAATAKSVEGLLPLADRYPNDARVLRALMLGFASRAAGLADAMKTARRLIAAAEEEARNPELQYLVSKAAETPGPAAELAWKILRDDMGSAGPDLLYTMMLTRPRVAERAESLLRDLAVRQRSSPALAIAYELRSASSCGARVPLLGRATQAGDERSISVLYSLSTGSKHGCGKTKRKPCLPACPEQAEQFRAAAAKISRRLRSSND